MTDEDLRKMWDAGISLIIYGVICVGIGWVIVALAQ
jgi:hypothetical protein